MRTPKSTLAMLAALCVMAASPAQSPALRKELAKREAAAKSNADTLVQVAAWAKGQGMSAESTRILEAVLKSKPDHEGANRAMGREQVGGVWMTAQAAEQERQRLRAAELAAKGLVEIEGVVVAEAQAEEARRGIFRSAGRLVTKEEFAQLSAGKVLHPITGEPIDAARLEDARARRFPVGTEGRWVEEAEADRYHSQDARPWELRTEDFVLSSTMPLARIEAAKVHADRTVQRLRPLLGLAAARMANRPLILLAADAEEFQALGSRMGDAGSAFGAFLATDGVIATVPLQGTVRPVVCLWDEAWGPYNVPHAVGLALVGALADELDTEVPTWFLHGLAAYGSRFESRPTGAWFAQRLAKLGGLQDPGRFLSSFAIDGSMEFDAIDATVTQAGLLIAFCVDGGCEPATKALEGVSAAFAARKASAIDKAVKALQAALASQSAPITDYMVKLVKEQG